MARVIAFYLPQFHPIPENDLWWGKGFTEWTNVGKAKPLFRNHYQPRVPADLGYYDLRLPEVRELQAELARNAGIEGFCYYHYWFGNGKQLLERPFNEVVESGAPNYPFCICWANHTWSNATWDRDSARIKDTILMKQEYGGDQDYIQHFYSLLNAFRDNRYIKVDGKNIFFIYDILAFSDVESFMLCWQQLAKKEGLPPFYFVAMLSNTLACKISENGERQYTKPNLKSAADVYNIAFNLGFDAVNSLGMRRGEMMYRGMYVEMLDTFLRSKKIELTTKTFDYKKVTKNFFAPEDSWENVFPTIIPQWDRTARVGKAQGIYVNSTPDNFKQHIIDAINVVKNKQPEHQIILLKSWNEWAEGNYVEPDLKYGHGYLNALQDVLSL